MAVLLGVNPIELWTVSNLDYNYEMDYTLVNSVLIYDNDMTWLTETFQILLASLLITSTWNVFHGLAL